jgi:hypothetical protein
VKTAKKVSYTTATVNNRIAGWVDLAGRCGYNVPRRLLMYLNSGNWVLQRKKK